ncbi:MAG: 3D domain-containing protein [Actinomycetota bacterium]
MKRTAGHRKNSDRNAPPTGGFAFTRSFALMLVVILAAALPAVAPRAVSVASALAQTAPGSQDADSLVRELVTLDSEIGDLDSRTAELESRSEELGALIEQTDADVEANRERLASKRAVLTARARSIYINGRSNGLLLLFTSDDFSDFLAGQEMLKKVSRNDAALVKQTKEQARELAGSLSELKAQKKEVDEVASDIKSRRDRLADRKADRQQVLARAGERQEQIQQQSAGVEQKMQDLNPPEVTGRPTGKVFTMVATAYSPEEPGLSDSTATGLKAQRGVVAVDPRVIPLGTRVNVEGYGYAIAADTGGAIKGMRIDLCFDTLAECNAYGRRTVRVEILD